MQVVAGDGLGNSICGFNTANTNANYTGMEAGVFLVPNGTNPFVWYVENGTPGYAGTFVSVGDYIGVFRVGSTLTIRKSTTKPTTLSSWTTIYTFGTFTSSAALYMNINQSNSGSNKLYYPQCLNCQ